MLRQQTDAGASGIPSGVLTVESDALPPAPLPPASDLSGGRPPKKAPAAPRVAFGWVDEASVLSLTRATPALENSTAPYVPVTADLLSDAPRRSPWRPGVLVPVGIIALLLGGYSATTLLWPLHSVAPEITAVAVQPVAAPVTTPAWPAVGSAAVEVAGIDGVTASTTDADTIASITKVVTALLVLDRMPLALGEQGPEYAFTGADRTRYWSYRANGESALDVPVGGTLTQYQLLEGMLIGSANNYADRLAGNLWPNDRVFASAAQSWLETHGVPGVTIVDPSGIEMGNVASPEALIPLAERALANPVIAEIVAKQSVELPGAGLVENTNGLLVDPGVLGIKTGSLDRYNLLSAKTITVGDTAVRLYASVLGQPDDATRVEASRALYAQLEQELQLRPSVTADTLAGTVKTLWGAKANVLTAADADVILWNGGVGEVTTTYALDDSRKAGDTVGSLSVRGPLDSTTVDLRLSDDIDGPSPWWRLTHPLDLFGLNG